MGLLLTHLPSCFTEIKKTEYRRTYGGFTRQFLLPRFSVRPVRQVSILHVWLFRNRRGIILGHEKWRLCNQETYFIYCFFYDVRQRTKQQRSAVEVSRAHSPEATRLKRTVASLSFLSDFGEGGASCGRDGVQFLSFL